MATLGATYPTLVDLAKAQDPNGTMAKVTELLAQKNPLIEDLPFKQGNLTTGHRTTSRTSLPSVSFRRINQGVTPSKGRTDQADDVCGMLTGRSVVDPELARLSGNPQAYLAQQSAAFLASMANAAEDAFIYSSTSTAPEEILGLAPRFNSTTGIAGSQVVLCEPAAETDGSDQTSMWFLGLGTDTVYGITPKGSGAGLESIVLPDQLVDDGTGNSRTMRAHVTEWIWRFGLCVEDWRYVVRLANIDTSVLAATGETDDTLIPAMIRAYNQMYDVRNVNPKIYMNRTVNTYLWLQARNATKGSTLAVTAPEGKPMLSFMGIPIRIADGILEDEAELA